MIDIDALKTNQFYLIFFCYFIKPLIIKYVQKNCKICRQQSITAIKIRGQYNASKYICLKIPWMCIWITP